VIKIKYIFKRSKIKILSYFRNFQKMKRFQNKSLILVPLL